MTGNNLNNLSKIATETLSELEKIKDSNQKLILAKLIAELENEIAEARVANTSPKWYAHKNIQTVFAVLIAACAVFAYALNYVKPIIEKDLVINQKIIKLKEIDINTQGAEIRFEKQKNKSIEQKNSQLSKTLKKQTDEIEKVKAQTQARIAVAQRQIEKLLSRLEEAKSKTLGLKNIQAELASLTSTLDKTLVINVYSDSELFPLEEAEAGISGFVKITFEIDSNGKPSSFQTVAQSDLGNFGLATYRVITNYLSKNQIRSNRFALNDNRWEAMIIFTSK